MKQNILLTKDYTKLIFHLIIIRLKIASQSQFTPFVLYLELSCACYPLTHVFIHEKLSCGELIEHVWQGKGLSSTLHWMTLNRRWEESGLGHSPGSPNPHPPHPKSSAQRQGQSAYSTQRRQAQLPVLSSLETTVSQEWWSLGEKERGSGVSRTTWMQPQGTLWLPVSWGNGQSHSLGPQHSTFHPASKYSRLHFITLHSAPALILYRQDFLRTGKRLHL